MDAGGADLAEALVSWARRRRLSIRVGAADFNRETRALASRQISHLQGAEAVADAFALPFAPVSFDYVHCARVPAPLRDRGRRAASATSVQPHRRGLVVNDLHRHPLSLLPWTGVPGCCPEAPWSGTTARSACGVGSDGRNWRDWETWRDSPGTWWIDGGRFDSWRRLSGEGAAAKRRGSTPHYRDRRESKTSFRTAPAAHPRPCGSAR